MKELQDVVNPIMTRMYQEAGGDKMPGGMPGGMPEGMSGGMPSAEEVD